MSNFPRQRIEEISPWLDDENFQVKRFAKQVYESLNQYLEREEAKEKLRECNW